MRKGAARQAPFERVDRISESNPQAQFHYEKSNGLNSSSAQSVSASCLSTLGSRLLRSRRGMRELKVVIDGDPSLPLNTSIAQSRMQQSKFRL